MFVLIGTEAHTLPYAIRLDGSNVKEALAEVQSMIVKEEPSSFQASFLVDMGAQSIHRVYCTQDRKMAITDAESSFETLGLGTAAEYFEEKVGTMEIAE